MTGTGRVVVPDWWDIFTLHENMAECPDCDQRSPEMRDVFALAQWVEQHITDCPERVPS